MRRGSKFPELCKKERSRADSVHRNPECARYDSPPFAQFATKQLRACATIFARALAAAGLGWDDRPDHQDTRELAMMLGLRIPSVPCAIALFAALGTTRSILAQQ